MTANLQRPLRARAGLRAEIYKLKIRVRQTPAYHPLRLHLEESLAELTAELSEIEQCIGGSLPRRTSILAAAPEPAPIGDRPPAADPACVAKDDIDHAGNEETRSVWIALEKHEPGEPGQAPSTASIAAWYRRAIVQPLHFTGVLAARATAGVFRCVQRMLDTVGESVIEFVGFMIRAPGGFARRLGETFRYCGAASVRQCRRAVTLAQGAIAGAFRLLQHSLDALIARGRQFAARVSRSVSHLIDRLQALFGDCLVATANAGRRAGAVTGGCFTASVSWLLRLRQMIVATAVGLLRLAREAFIRTFDQMRAFLGQCRLAADQGVRRAHTVASEGFAAARRLLLQRVVPTASKAESFRRIVISRIGDGLRTGAGTGRRVVQRASAAANRGLTYCGLFLQKVMAEAPGKGRELSARCRLLTVRISERGREALAMHRPAAIQALRNVQTAALRNVARRQETILTLLRTARAKWAPVCRHAVLAGAAAGRRFASTVKAGARRSIANGRQILQKVMPAAQISFAAFSTFSRRLSLRPPDRISAGARHLASLRAARQGAWDAAQTFGGGGVSHPPQRSVR